MRSCVVFKIEDRYTGYADFEKGNFSFAQSLIRLWVESLAKTTMDHINQLIAQRRADFDRQEEERKKLRDHLYSSEIEEKNKKLIGLRKEVKELEDFLANALGVSVAEIRGESQTEEKKEASPKESLPKADRKKREKSLPEEEKIKKVADLLRGHTEGLSAVEISKAIGDTYNTVNKHLAERTDLYFKTGNKRTTKFHRIQKAEMGEASQGSGVIEPEKSK